MEIFVICCIAVFLVYLGFILTRYFNYHRLKQTFKKTLKRHSNMLKKERSIKSKRQNRWIN
jgi:hypothetical protein